MHIENSLLSTGDIAKKLNINKSSISAMVNNGKFPRPVATLSSGPVWQSSDVVDYIVNNLGINAYYEKLPVRTIALLGIAGSGKSTFVSKFISDAMAYRRLFTGETLDDTVCVMYIHISDDNDHDEFALHVNFSKVYPKKDEDTERDALSGKLATYNGVSFPFEDVESWKEVKALICSLKKYDSERDNKLDISVEIKARPSNYAKDVLREKHLSELIFVDTPGVTGYVPPSLVDKSDMYMFFVRRGEKTDIDNLHSAVDSVKEDAATSDIAYIYDGRKPVINRSQYERYKQNAVDYMTGDGDFSSGFKSLRDNESIIENSADVLNPENRALCFPYMATDEDDEITEGEKLFFEEIKTMIPGSDRDKAVEEGQEVQELVKITGFAELVLDILKSIPCHKITAGDKVYNGESFKNEHHNRVMTCDDYRIYSALGRGYISEKELLYNYFKSFKVSDYPEEWQRNTIKLVYKALSASVKDDRGLGNSSHPFEDPKKRTMYVEEGLLSEQLCEALNLPDTNATTQYVATLKDNNIYSNTWGYVTCKDKGDSSLADELYKKLQIQASLRYPDVYNLDDYILFHYIQGLRKIEEYQIMVKILGIEEDKAFATVCDLPF